MIDQNKLSKALAASRQALFEIDVAGQTLSWADDAGVREIFGLDQSAAPPTIGDLLANVDYSHVTARASAIETALEAEGSYTVEYQLGDTWVEERGTILSFGSSQRIVGFLRCLEAQKKREKTLTHLASYDELTGQLNRVKFKELLDGAVTAVREEARSGALFLIGIDNVGSINNDFGFDIADQVIVEVATRIERTVGDRGVFGRVAGTKFGCILNDGDQNNVIDIARAVMNAMREDVILTRSGGIAVSVCIGATYLTPKICAAAEAMVETEAAFDQARRKGPSSFEIFTETTELVSRRKQNTEVSDVILTALNDRRVYLAYQPIVADISAPKNKFECLIRMRGDNGEEIPAPQFIPAAERLGLVHLLDRRVLELALRTLADVPNIHLNVNLSWETVRDAVWAEGYISHLRANAAVCNRLTIELTETQMVDAIDMSVEFISAIKELGCHFAIDDFGAGYTSFRNLKALDIDILKIDGSFVTGVSTSRDNQTFVRTLLDLARNFRLQTVAEWVDNEQDAQLLKALGVDYLQGFYIGRPSDLPIKTLQKPVLKSA